MSLWDDLKSIQSSHNSLRFKLLSLAFDQRSVASLLAQLTTPLLVAANLRCGAWYVDSDVQCHFKSTDGHRHHLYFTVQRLQLRFARQAAAAAGCVIVDATRKGKRFPDSFSRTLPIWCAVLNRIVDERWQQLSLPSCVAASDASLIDSKLSQFVALARPFVEACELRQVLKKPFRCVWLSADAFADTDVNALVAAVKQSFTPIVCVSASRTAANAPFREYCPGAGDDEESWARGLTPPLLFEHRDALLAHETDEALLAAIAQLVARAKLAQASAWWRAAPLQVHQTSITMGVGALRAADAEQNYDCILDCCFPPLASSLASQRVVAAPLSSAKQDKAAKKLDAFLATSSELLPVQCSRILIVTSAAHISLAPLLALYCLFRDEPSRALSKTQLRSALFRLVDHDARLKIATKQLINVVNKRLLSAHRLQKS